MTAWILTEKGTAWGRLATNSFFRLPPAAQPFRRDVEQRNDENAEQGGREHTPEHRRADGLARDRAGAAGDDQREETENKGDARHHHRPESQARAFDRGSLDVLAQM